MNYSAVKWENVPKEFHPKANPLCLSDDELREESVNWWLSHEVDKSTEKEAYDRWLIPALEFAHFVIGEFDKIMRKATA